MHPKILRRLGKSVLLAGFLALLASGCSSTKKGPDRRHQILVSVDEQQMLVLADNQPIRQFRISTSRFGLGDRPGSNFTPMGRMQIEDKIGDNQPAGMVFKGRRPTGEVLRPNAPGRDPIVSRILWLRGVEAQNRNAYGRYIYIHGTPEERNLGRPASFGCIRMASADVIDLYNIVGEGARVDVVRGKLPYHTGAFGRWTTTRGNSADASRLAMSQEAGDSAAALAAEQQQAAVAAAQAAGGVPAAAAMTASSSAPAAPAAVNGPPAPNDKTTVAFTSEHR